MAGSTAGPARRPPFSRPNWAWDAATGVAYLGFNTPDMMALLFACARLGAILVPMNWRLTAAELGFIAGDCAPKALFHDVTTQHLPPLPRSKRPDAPPCR